LKPFALGRDRSAYCRPLSPKVCSAGRSLVTMNHLPDHGAAIAPTPSKKLQWTSGRLDASVRIN
jgi:hypothetical protein